MLREMKHITRETLCDDETEITVRQLAQELNQVNLLQVYQGESI